MRERAFDRREILARLRAVETGDETLWERELQAALETAERLREGYYVDAQQQRERAETAEARVKELEGERIKHEGELRTRDQILKRLRKCQSQLSDVKAIQAADAVGRREAEARVRTLTEALDDIARGCSTWGPNWTFGLIEKRARTALTPWNEGHPDDGRCDCVEQAGELGKHGE